VRLYRALRIERKELVALVGGGGKTSALFRLGEELAAQGWRVVTTTSTHIGADQVSLAPHVITQPAGKLTGQLLTHRHTLLVGEIDHSINKASGLRPDVIDRLIPVLGLDAVINEADGARTLPFKAPADHEPVISPGTTLVVPVVGLDVIGQPLDAAHVHRPERIVALSGAEIGRPVTPELVAMVMMHPEGGLKGVPDRARVVALINKVDRGARIELATGLADRLLQSPRITAVAITALQEPDPVLRVKSRVAAIVLAAGASRRFGELKQLASWGDQGTLLTHAVDVALASPAHPVIVVLGREAAACRQALGERPVTIVVNPDWEKGQSTSMQVGLNALPENVDAALFHLVDQPGVTPQVLEALIARHALNLAPVIWPTYEGQRGNPVLFDRVAFPLLRRVTGDVGGKPVLMTYSQTGEADSVRVQEPGILLDIDHPQDLDKV
jgi:molybdenum cofactor cytidylyltransferase